MSDKNVKLSGFERILFFTGAGLSAESGIPTYRGQGGIWHEYNYQEYACQRAFDADPEKVWDFHDKRREAVANCEPNEGHKIIAAIQKQKPGTAVITQNIDGLHQRAGSTKVTELHGSMWRIRCEREGTVEDNFDVPLVPRMCSCGSYWRPGIVWFEDSLDAQVMQDAYEKLEECDLIVSIGTSGVVYPAANLPRIATERGITSIEINLEDTPVSHLYTHCMRGKASEILRGLDS